MAATTEFQHVWDLTSCDIFSSTTKDTFCKFTKDVRWSPDGLRLLTADDADHLHLFEFNQSESKESPSNLKTVLNVTEGETIYDYAWYPYMDSTNPATCCFVASSRDHPLHLWDANTGKLRATYRGYDHLDEITAAFSTCFSSDGSKLIAGYNRCIRIFDVAVPGKPIHTTMTSKTRKSRHGQRGMISALTTSYFEPDIFAAGSYRGSVYLYDSRTGKSESEIVGTSYGPSIGGITQLKFSPDGRFLFSASRRGKAAEESHVVCWDYRKPGQVLSSYPRMASTHQHIGFDIDWTSQYLITGSDDNNAIIYNLNTGEIVTRLSGSDHYMSDMSEDGIKSDTSSGGVVNGVSFHPRGQPYIVLSTGTRHIKEPYEEGITVSPSEGVSTGQLIVYKIPMVEMSAIEAVEMSAIESTVEMEAVVSNSSEITGETTEEIVTNTKEDDQEDDQVANKKQKVVEETIQEEESIGHNTKRKFTFKGKEMIVFEYEDGSVCLREVEEDIDQSDKESDLKFTSVQWEVLQAALST